MRGDCLKLPSAILWIGLLGYCTVAQSNATLFEETTFSTLEGCAKDVEWRHGTVLNTSTDSSNVRSTMDCAWRCGTDPQCRAFNFECVQYLCILFSDGPKNCSELDYAADWMVYTKSNDVSEPEKEDVEDIFPIACPDANTCNNTWTKIFELDIDKTIVHGSDANLLEIAKMGVNVRAQIRFSSGMVKTTFVVSYHISYSSEGNFVIFELPEKVGTSRVYNRVLRYSYLLSSSGQLMSSKLIDYQGTFQDAQQEKEDVGLAVYVQSPDCLRLGNPVFGNTTCDGADQMNNDTAWNAILQSLQSGAQQLVVQIDGGSGYLATYISPNSLAVAGTKSIAVLGGWPGIKSLRSFTSLGNATVGTVLSFDDEEVPFQEYVLMKGLGQTQQIRKWVYSNSFDETFNDGLCVKWHVDSCWRKIFDIEEEGTSPSGYGRSDLYDELNSRHKILLHFTDKSSPYYAALQIERTLKAPLVECDINSKICSVITETLPNLYKSDLVSNQDIRIQNETLAFRTQANVIQPFQMTNSSTVEILQSYSSNVTWYKDSREWRQVFYVQCCSSLGTGNIPEAVLAGADFILDIRDLTSGVRELWAVDNAECDPTENSWSLATPAVLRVGGTTPDTECPSLTTRWSLTFEADNASAPSLFVSSWGALFDIACMRKLSYTTFLSAYEVRVYATYE